MNRRSPPSAVARRLRREMTPEERTLWRELRGQRLGVSFRRQEPMGRYVADFVCYSRRLVVELDGSQHAGSASDAKRDADMAAHGFRTLRFWNSEVRGNLPGVLWAIEQALARFQDDSASPLPPQGEGREGGLPHVFVYGTLMPGGRNAHWANAVSTPEVQTATLRGFALYGLGRYPGIVPEAQGVVRGVLYTYPPGDMARVLAALDTLEGYRGPGHPENLFDRQPCEVTLASGETRPAWTYVYARPLPAGQRPLGEKWSERA